MSADLADRLTAWTAALDALDAEADRAESLLAARADTAHVPGPDTAGAAVTGAWSPSAGLGDLPAALRPRAERLLARQQDLARRTGAAVDTTRRQTHVARGFDLRPPAVPVYLDSEG